eukprot:jgi/Mesvir1/16495/Mv10048-RA.1
MPHVFVSGCYDILHGGHVQFFQEARAIADSGGAQGELTVSFASEEVLWHHKRRRSSIPDEHKQVLIAALKPVTRCVIGTDRTLGLDFESHFLRLRPDYLVVTEDDKYGDIKRKLCTKVGAEYRVLPKTPPHCKPISTTEIVARIKAPDTLPLRVDFAGGWLDVPRHSREDGRIVNCSISPLVSLFDWGPYRREGGLGGSGAYALLSGQGNGVGAELALGVGWQDPAVIRETGLCVWESGPAPRLLLKRDGEEMLKGKMALFWTPGGPHDTPRVADNRRDYDAIFHAGDLAAHAVAAGDYRRMCRAVQLSYEAQLGEGMDPIMSEDDLSCIQGLCAYKYCGGGWGGYAVFLFESEEDRSLHLAAEREKGKRADWLVVEPYIQQA